MLLYKNKTNQETLRIFLPFKLWKIPRLMAKYFHIDHERRTCVTVYPNLVKKSQRFTYAFTFTEIEVLLCEEYRLQINLTSKTTWNVSLTYRNIFIDTSTVLRGTDSSYNATTEGPRGKSNRVVIFPCVEFNSLRASSPIWASETSRARTREQAAKPRGAEARTACNNLS